MGKNKRRPSGFAPIHETRQVPPHLPLAMQYGVTAVDVRVVSARQRFNILSASRAGAITMFGGIDNYLKLETAVGERQKREVATAIVEQAALPAGTPPDDAAPASPEVLPPETDAPELPELPETWIEWVEPGTWRLHTASGRGLPPPDFMDWLDHESALWLARAVLEVNNVIEPAGGNG